MTTPLTPERIAELLSEIARLLDDLEARRIPDDEIRHRVRLARTELQRADEWKAQALLWSSKAGMLEAESERLRGELQRMEARLWSRPSGAGEHPGDKQD